MPAGEQLITFLVGLIADTEAGFSLGTFGAIAEFTRDPGEPASLFQDRDRVGVVTGRGGIRLVPRPELRPIASESPTKEASSHRVALCLPRSRCAMNGSTELTELGLDTDAGVALLEWLSGYDRPLTSADEDPAEALH